MMNAESYSLDLGRRLASYGFDLIDDPARPMSFATMYTKREFKITRFGFMDTVCIVAFVGALDDVDLVRNYSADAMAVGVARSQWPLGLGRGVIVYPLLVAGHVASEVEAWISTFTRPDFSAFEFPVIVDLSRDGALSYNRGTPFIGFVYARKNRLDAERYFRATRSTPTNTET